MTLTISATELAANLSEVLERVRDYAADVRAGIASQGPVRVVDWPT